MLGIADGPAVWSELQERLGRPVFEVPTLPPSVPGMRVAARAAGARCAAPACTSILNVVVHAAERSGGRVTALRARVGLRDVTHECDWVVLATGGFASGGVALDSHWQAREVALGLPVTGVPSGERFGPELLRRPSDGPRGRRGRPTTCGRGGTRTCVVVGATLAGAQPWREKSGDGISLATGHRAAELILGAAQPAQSAEAAR